MAGSLSSRKSMRSYRVKSSNLAITVGDDVLVRPSTGSKPWVAKVDKILSDKFGRNVTVVGRWYYRPADTRGGQKDFHGTSELFLSNHSDKLRPKSIDGKCKVHTLKEYQKLEMIGPDDYYCRLMYDPLNDSFQPDRLPLYCSCKKPYNPDLNMVQCEECREWFHIGMTDAEVEATAHFICGACRGAEASCKNTSATSSMESPQVQGTSTPAKRRRVAAAGPRR